VRTNTTSGLSGVEGVYYFPHLTPFWHPTTMFLSRKLYEIACTKDLEQWWSGPIENCSKSSSIDQRH